MTSTARTVPNAFCRSRLRELSSSLLVVSELQGGSTVLTWDILIPHHTGGNMAGLFATLRQYLRDSAAASQRAKSAPEPIAVARPHRATVVHPEFGIRKVRRQGATITLETRDFSKSTTRDLRDLPASEFGIQGYSFYVEAKSEQINDVYRLVREPANKHDSNAIAVFNGPRKIGFVSATKAASYAPLLDSISADTFLIGGVVRDRGKMLLLLPSLPALRKVLKT